MSNLHLPLPLLRSLLKRAMMMMQDPEMALVVLSGAHDIGNSRGLDRFVCNSSAGFSAGSLGSRGVVRGGACVTGESEVESLARSRTVGA